MPDNDFKFLEFVIREARLLDPNCLIDVKSRVRSHLVSIQTVREYKVRMLETIKNVHHRFGIPFRASQFIKNRETIISFELYSA